MSIGQVAFVLLGASVSAGLLVFGFKRDRVLGVAVPAGLTLYLAGAIGMGMYLQSVHGREYSASDELGFLGDGEQIARSWRTGVPYEQGMRGIYSSWNALVISAWGRSLLPFRVANAIVGAAAVVAAFLLAQELFRSLWAARAAALFVLFSPSLFAWTMMNLRERLLGLGVLLGVLTAIRLVHRWGFVRLGLFVVSLWALGGVRVYYGAILGWLMVAGYPILARTTIRRRLLTSAAVFVAVGLVLKVLTTSFMGTGLRNDTPRRYVTATKQQSAPSVSSPTDDPAAPFGTTGTRPPPRPTTVGMAQPAPLPENPWELAARLAFVLFGRWEPRNGEGRIMSMLLRPEWLLTFLLVPLGGWSVWQALRRGFYEALLPAGFIAANILLLTWIHGDAWTTYRLKAVYWPLFLTMAAAGASFLFAPPDSPPRRTP